MSSTYWSSISPLPLSLEWNLDDEYRPLNHRIFKICDIHEYITMACGTFIVQLLFKLQLLFRHSWLFIADKISLIHGQKNIFKSALLCLEYLMSIPVIT